MVRQTGIADVRHSGRASAVKNKYGDKVAELDTHIGTVLKKIKDLGIEENTH